MWVPLLAANLNNGRRCYACLTLYEIVGVQCDASFPDKIMSLHN